MLDTSGRPSGGSCTIQNPQAGFFNTTANRDSSIQVTVLDRSSGHTWYGRQSHGGPPDDVLGDR